MSVYARQKEQERLNRTMEKHISRNETLRKLNNELRKLESEFALRSTNMVGDEEIAFWEKLSKLSLQDVVDMDYVSRIYNQNTYW